MHSGMKFLRLKNNLIIISFIFLLSACSSISSSNDVFKQYTVGVGTHNKNEIWGRVIRFDTGWSMPSGSISCCWEEAGATTTAYDQSMPKEIYVEWIEQSTKLLYRAYVKITPEITKLAVNLPEYTRIRVNKKVKKIYLIIGLGKSGEVVVWLSNAPHGINISGRKLYIVGNEKAYSEPWVRPSDR